MGHLHVQNTKPPHSRSGCVATLANNFEKLSDLQTGGNWLTLLELHRPESLPPFTEFRIREAAAFSPDSDDTWLPHHSEPFRYTGHG